MCIRDSPKGGARVFAHDMDCQVGAELDSDARCGRDGIEQHRVRPSKSHPSTVWASGRELLARRPSNDQKQA
eukprot:8456246-Lingulodinium_polyedra.AAC.1